MIHIFLDLDNTVTESRQKISPKMKKLLSRFKTRLTVISGAAHDQMAYQLDGLDVDIMSQNGNVNQLWQRFLSTEEVESIMAHISLYGDLNAEDRVENRGAQISYSFTGHNADLEVKKRFDPMRDKRKRILDQFPAPEGIEAKVAGTTCIDYFPDGLNKGANIYKYIAWKGWPARSCLYIGDALFPGGNDESVIGIIPTFPVENPEGTYNFLFRRK